MVPLSSHEQTAQAVGLDRASILAFVIIGELQVSACGHLADLARPCDHNEQQAKRCPNKPRHTIRFHWAPHASSILPRRPCLRPENFGRGSAGSYRPRGPAEPLFILSHFSKCESPAPHLRGYSPPNPPLRFASIRPFAVPRSGLAMNGDWRASKMASSITP